MRQKTWIIALTLLIIGGALGGGLYWRWLNSPRYALQQAALALEARNMDNFYKYVNIKEIFNNNLEASRQDQEKPASQPDDDWTKYSRHLGRKFAYLFMPKLFDAFQDQIRDLISHYLLKLDHSQILAITAAVTVAQIDTQGDEAAVTLTNPKTKETLHFQMRRQPNQGVWQIVSVNYQDLKKFYKREIQP
ncbi:MAG TPA: hypothetical protein VE082_06400 [Desulfobaccales bacterium]|nr:hypothetical protein [Desulfobaccales bacterium]